MPYTLIIGNKNYSSWSMRAWLLLKFAGTPFEEISINLYSGDSQSKVKALGGQTGLVPVLKSGDTTVWDTLAITEFLYESFPKIWPASSQARARARSFCGEVHSSLSHLRDAMPMNTRGRHRQAPITPDVTNEVQRVSDIWTYCAENYDGPWMFGEFCGADIIFAPLASRFLTYDVTLTGVAYEYQQKLLAHPLVVEWFELGLKETACIEKFELPGIK